MLLGVSSILSSLIGFARGKFVAWMFGAGPQTDAYFAAFRLPDLMTNFLVGGAVSITFVTLLNRYRQQDDSEAGERLLFTVFHMLMLVLATATVVLMLLAAPLNQRLLPGFAPEVVRQSAYLTRILLPAQIFLVAGGILGANLLVRKQFLYQAAQPIIYNLTIILCGVLLHRWLGIASLAVGATLGFFFGAFLITLWGIRRAGIRYRWVLDLNHPGLVVWFRMTLPLMLGFGLPFLDQFFTGYYASHGAGDITRLSTAKQLIGAPISMLSLAAGAASLPFFSQLWTQKKHYEFAVGVADAVSRVLSLSLLAASLMMALASPMIGLFFGGGRYGQSDVQRTALFFAIYALSLGFWAAQAIYARAFYAAGLTWLPMLASTAITVAAIPIYRIGYHFGSTAGLVWASNIGIALQALVLAGLLHKRRMVSIASLDFAELGRCLSAGLLAGVATWLLFDNFFVALLPAMAAHVHLLKNNHVVDVLLLLLGSLVWTAIAGWVLDQAGSALPRVLLRRTGLKR